jgi:hypothetical protein
VTRREMREKKMGMERREEMREERKEEKVEVER